MYANDLSDVFESAKINSYADGTATCAQGQTAGQAEVALTSQLEIASKWLHDNKLTLNVLKTKAKTISHRVCLFAVQCRLPQE